MGQVVPFIARVRDSGDWSATERARLEELADRLASGGVHVEVIFGATDEGDPWCVVTDADGDVLIHVARIDGKFVVHSAIDDAVNESVDLHTALRERLAATEEMMAPTSAVVLPFTARQGQTFLALLAATAFFYETSAIGDTAEASEPVQASPPAEPPPPPPEAETPTQERENAQGVALQPSDPGPTPMLVAAQPAVAAPAAPAVASPPPVVETPHAAPAETLDLSVGPSAPTAPATVIQGTAGDDLLAGTAEDEHIIGGDGDDTLQGGGGRDLLEGGAGNDVLEVTGEVTAIGGAGADTFVIHAPVHAGRPETLLGVIFDYSGLEGDRVLGFGGGAIHFLPRPRPDADKQAPPTGDGQTPPKPDPEPDLIPPSDGDFGTTLVGPRPPLTRVDVDLNGDGVADGYLLIGTRSAPAEPPPINATVGAGLGVDPLG
ncbi:calcium-binding protein [Phenylobacterium sp.]|uniref:calcium-binding protein n=1 Tax=Phenylobacterium sp. TaxID=1871053 RepID=UPI002EDA4EE1